MTFCHSEIGRPYFFSIEGKSDAGPGFGHGVVNSGTGDLLNLDLSATNKVDAMRYKMPRRVPELARRRIFARRAFTVEVPLCQSRVVEFDPLAFRGTAEYYSIGRPPYSTQLATVLARELSLDGTGQLLDVGCGPGVLELELARAFEHVVALDPEVGMLSEGQRRCQRAGIDNVRWALGVAEEIPALDLGSCRVVTFGQSFHRVHQHDVAEIVYDVLEPGGSLVLISNAVEGRPRPVGPDYPSVPHDSIRELIITYLGEDTRRYLATWNESLPARFEDALSETRFGGSRTIYAPGRPDLIRDVDAVVANSFSLSYAAPRLFAERRNEFEEDLRRLLYEDSPTGLFWDWPGDTEIIVATKPE